MKTRINTFPVLTIITQRPRAAFRAARHVAVGIAVYIRQAVLGDPLIPYEVQVDRTLATILSEFPWSHVKRQWFG